MVQFLFVYIFIFLNIQALHCMNNDQESFLLERTPNEILVDILEHSLLLSPNIEDFKKEIFSLLRTCKKFKKLISANTLKRAKKLFLQLIEDDIARKNLEIIELERQVITQEHFNFGCYEFTGITDCDEVINMQVDAYIDSLDKTKTTIIKDLERKFDKIKLITCLYLYKNNRRRNKKPSDTKCKLSNIRSKSIL